ncbi:MAG: hypothetical protein EON48_13735 [Acetobacteraceae bacterium]|nr:MAG: hypothetical protein EON48_13735 [Acetobacteraceae bacterium]
MPPPRIALFAEQGHFTAVHNLTFRVVMPQLSGSAWKVLCFLISETVGYQRRSELISYSAIMAGTGLRSSATVSKALTELLADEPFGCPLIVRQLGERCGATSRESSRYGLNLKCTVALQKVNRDASKNEARRISDAAFFEACFGSENEAPVSSPNKTGRDQSETSNELLSPEENLESEHFIALCEVCQLDRDLLSPRKKANATQRAAQLATKYSPDQIRQAGARWPLPAAPHPDQLLDSMPSLLNRKERHEPNQSRAPSENSPPRNDRPTNEHQRNAAERRQLMGELASRFG